jgi:hypothetical protein
MRTFSSAEATFFATVGNGNYGTVDALMAQTLVDSQLGSGTKSGYNLTKGTSPAASTTSYVMGAAPTATGVILGTGTREFCIDETGVLRGKVAAGTAATTTCGTAFGAPVGN